MICSTELGGLRAKRNRTVGAVCDRAQCLITEYCIIRIVRGHRPLLSKLGNNCERILLPLGEGSMKGAVKTNTLPESGRRNVVVAASPISVETMGRVGSKNHPSLVLGRRSSETEKQRAALVPAKVLFESQRTIAFPGRARGDRVAAWVLGRSHGPTSPKILTLGLVGSEDSRRPAAEMVVLPANPSERLCLPIQFL